MSLEELTHNDFQSVDADLALWSKEGDAGVFDRSDLSSKQNDFHIDDFGHDSFHQQELTRKEELLSSAELRDKCKDAQNVSTFLDFEPDFYDEEEDEDDYLMYPFFNLNTGLLF